MNYGKAIRIVRSSRGLSQAQLGERMGTDASHISRIEAGQRGVSLKTLEACAKALQIPVFLLALVASNPDDLKGLPADLVRNIAASLLQILADMAIDGEGLI